MRDFKIALQHNFFFIAWRQSRLDDWASAWSHQTRNVFSASFRFRLKIFFFASAVRSIGKNKIFARTGFHFSFLFLLLISSLINKLLKNSFQFHYLETYRVFASTDGWESVMRYLKKENDRSTMQWHGRQCGEASSKRFKSFCVLKILLHAFKLLKESRDLSLASL